MKSKTNLPLAHLICLRQFTGLTKGRIKNIAKSLGAPKSLIDKIPTADLENLKPLHPDEEVYGISYQQIDDYLEGKPLSESIVKNNRRLFFKNPTQASTTHLSSVFLRGAMEAPGIQIRTGLV